MSTFSSGTGEMEGTEQLPSTSQAVGIGGTRSGPDLGRGSPAPKRGRKPGGTTAPNQ